MINWRRKDTELSGAEVAELGHFGLVLARINLVQAADFEASEPIWAEFFSPADFARWSEFQPGPRRTAFVAARLALRAATEGSAHGIHGIYYDERRPLLPKGFVSLSHGGQWAVAAYHPLLPVGIDVEGPRAQIGRVIARVASAQEVEALDHRLLWGAKEAVYKAAGQAEIRPTAHGPLAKDSPPNSARKPQNQRLVSAKPARGRGQNDQVRRLPPPRIPYLCASN